MERKERFYREVFGGGEGDLKYHSESKRVLNIIARLILRAWRI
jgi:hypothetical protein